MKRIVFLLMILGLFFSSCSKDDDTTPDDEKDGKITFYMTNGDCGPIEIELNDENVGPLTTVYIGTSEPTCGANNTLTIDVDVGIHDYYAADTCNNIWSGSIIINKGDCKVKLLNR
jgi:hypothetical protein